MYKVKALSALSIVFSFSSHATDNKPCVEWMGYLVTGQEIMAAFIPVIPKRDDWDIYKQAHKTIKVGLRSDGELIWDNASKVSSLPECSDFGLEGDVIGSELVEASKAQPSPYEPSQSSCDRLHSNLECFNDEYEVALKELGRNLGASLERWKDNKDVIDMLNQSQTNWSRYTKAHCDVISMQWTNEPAEQKYYKSCQIDATKDRTLELFNTYLVEENYAVAPGK